ncbi:MAG TPA: ABC transporter ATP-binding protein [Spirochaetia bacterium]|nr:ABC transporter ATP-binding protein [Spirochaetia bacterium]
MSDNTELLLEAQEVFGGYGSADILMGISMKVAKGEFVSIVGPNGAGKSTAMKSLFGLIKIRSGRVVFEGKEITKLRPDQIVRQGICYVPQEFNIFPTLTVKENLDMGAFIRNDDYSADLDRVYELFPILKERRRQLVGTMSGGQRQMVAMGRALMLQPRLLMLDEPSAGLSPNFIDIIFERIQEINKTGVGILLVEQNAKQALEISDRGYVLVMGKNRHEDTGPNLVNNKEVAEMFLGG